MTVGRPYDSDQTMTEYARILSAVAIVAIVACVTLGTTIRSFVQNVVGSLSRKRSETVSRSANPTLDVGRGAAAGLFMRRPVVRLMHSGFEVMCTA